MAKSFFLGITNISSYLGMAKSFFLGIANDFLFKEWQKVSEILAPDGPDEEAQKRERLKEVSQDLQRGWHDNKKV
jgi:hypothetical protein